jgi:hypothetical protein
MLTNLFSGIAVFAGLGSVATGIYALRVGRSTRAWLATPATILTSRLAPGPEGSTRASVSYRYTFGGAEFESECIRPISSYSSFSKPAQQVVGRYRATQQVIAFVNPAQPKEACLEPGVQLGASLAFIAIGLVFLALGTYRLLLALGFIEAE